MSAGYKITSEEIRAEIDAEMQRVSAAPGRVSVEMTHTQYAAIATALIHASFDPYITPEVRAEYVRLREVFTSAPMVGLTDN